MSTTTIQFRFLAFDAPADLAAPPALQSPPSVSPAFGVRRTDTLAAVVPAGTPMVRVGTGLYDYTFTDPAPGLTYLWWAQWTAPDGTTQYTQFQAAGAPASVPFSPYGTLGDVDAEIGQGNESTFSDPDATGDRDPYRAYAMDWATSFIDRRLAANGFATPAAPPASLAPLRFVFAKLAAWQLYQIRGQRDDKLGSHFDAKKKWAEAELEELLYLNRGHFTRAAGYADAPAAVAPTVDTRGATVRAAAPYPVVSWDGWVWSYVW